MAEGGNIERRHMSPPSMSMLQGGGFGAVLSKPTCRQGASAHQELLRLRQSSMTLSPPLHKPSLPPSLSRYAKHEVPRRHWADSSVEGFLRRGEPVVLTGGCPLAASLAHWSVARLRAADPSETWPVHFTPRSVKAVRRTYGAGLGEGGVREMSLDAFAAALEEEHAAAAGDCCEPRWHFYLQALLVWSHQSQRQYRPALSEVLRQELDTLVGWEWLTEACARTGCGGGFEACQMWCSPGGVTTPCHCESTRRTLIDCPSLACCRLPSPALACCRLLPPALASPIMHSPHGGRRRLAKLRRTAPRPQALSPLPP